MTSGRGQEEAKKRGQKEVRERPREAKRGFERPGDARRGQGEGQWLGEARKRGLGPPGRTMAANKKSI